MSAVGRSHEAFVAELFRQREKAWLWTQLWAGGGPLAGWPATDRGPT